MYRITDVDVQRNHLFLLHQIEGISYKPQSPYQVLMGANGSGKSTLLSLLTGNDPEGSHFHAGGSFVMRLDAQGTRYEVGYDVNKGIRYTFKVETSPNEWTELNPGATREVYRNLWETELGVTADTVALLSRKYRLTDMRASERQALFATITGVDVSYGMSAYDKLKRRLSAVKGAIKENHAELTKLISLRVDDDEVEQLRLRAAQLRQESQRALMDYRSDLPPYDQGEVESALTHFEGSRNQLRKLLNQRPATLPIPAADMESYREMVRAQVHQSESLRVVERGILEQFHQADDLFQRLTVEQNRGHIEFTNEAAQLQEELRQLESQVYFNPEIRYHDIVAVHRTLAEILPGWQQQVTDFRGGYTIADAVAKRDTARLRLLEIERGINTLQGAIDAIESHLKHLNEPHSDHCAKCGYSATAERTAKAIAGNMEKLEGYRTRIAAGRELLAKTQVEHAEYTAYAEDLGRIVGVTERYPHLKTYFARIFTEASLFDDPVDLIHVSNMCFMDVQAKLRISEIEHRQAEISKISGQLAQQSVGTLEELGSRVETLRTSYEQAFVALQRAIVLQQESQSSYTEANNYVNSVSTTLTCYLKDLERLHGICGIMLNEMARMHYTEVTAQAVAVETQLGERNVLESRIHGLEEHLGRLKVTQAKLQVLLNAISPQTGMLAKCSVEPITQFIDQMNYIIDRVWSHELRVLPYRPGKDVKLDYTFPLKVAGRDTLVPDISEGSDGQVEIVDFAFMVTGLLCKGNKGIPLLLDEIDRPMQPEHKESLMGFLIEAVESGWFSQIFVVSHHASAYTALPSPDMIELAPVPTNPAHNRVVEFS